METDDDLVCAARQGDEGAFSRLLARHRSRVFHWVMAVVGEREQAEDLTQETFWRVYRHRDDYVPRGQFVPYLKRIALNLARNRLRDRAREGEHQRALRQQAGETHPTSPPVQDPAILLSARLLQEEVRASLERLTPAHRQVLLLHYFGGLSLGEIAQQTGCPEGTIKTRLFHARRQMREHLSSPTANEREEPDER